MSNDIQLSSPFWVEVCSLLKKENVDPESAVLRFLKFIEDRRIPIDLVLNLGEVELAHRIATAEHNQRPREVAVY
jgi:hypothetical protein